MTCDKIDNRKLQVANLQQLADETDVLQQNPHKDVGRSHTHEYDVKPDDPAVKSKSKRYHIVNIRRSEKY